LCPVRREEVSAAEKFAGERQLGNMSGMTRNRYNTQYKYSGHHHNINFCSAEVSSRSRFGIVIDHWGEGGRGPFSVLWQPPLISKVFVSLQVGFDALRAPALRAPHLFSADIID
jgi:hypothetical protein